MIKSGLKKMLNNAYQRIIKNVVSLGNDEHLEKHHKPLTINGVNTPLQLSTTGAKVSELHTDKITSDQLDVITNTVKFASTSSSPDSVDVYTGGDKLIKLVEAANNGNYISFEDTAVGFTQATPTYNATDTYVYFNRSSQKEFLTFGAGNIADLNLYFPAVSGNFVLVIKQDGTGSRTVAADGWLAHATDGTAASGSSIVLWPGGTEPTLTTAANAVDIVSFYWDATNENAYAVISQDFK